MIRISDKSKCCGCTACMNICPMQCIVMRRDREGFDYPVANPDRCISCGRCEEVCPLHTSDMPGRPVAAFAARSSEYLAGSTSGGVFPALARNVIEDGGLVYGAVMNSDLTVSHAETDDMEGVSPMRGSKYVQSELYAVFDDVRSALEDGRKVMFTGTPCQAAGLKSYLGRDHDGLLLVDCACHGVPGPGLWEKYAKALGDRYGMQISGVRFRGKERSWRKYDVMIEGPDRSIVIPRSKDLYMLLFLQDMTLRPSCYTCPFRKGGSGSDLTIADLWNVSEAAPEMDDDKGVSLILANTEKGRAAVAAAELYSREVESEIAMKCNGAFSGNLEVPQRRGEFFQGIHSAKDIMEYMKGFVIRKPLPARIYAYLRGKAAGLKRRILK